MNNMAEVLSNQGKYEKVEEMHKQALVLRERLLGKKHSSTLASMSNLINVLSSRGKYDEAEEMHRQALTLTERVLWKEHPNTLTMFGNTTRPLGMWDHWESRSFCIMRVCWK